MGSKFQELLQPTETRDRDLAGQAVAVDGTTWLHQFLKDICKRYQCIEAFIRMRKRVIQIKFGYVMA